MSRSGRLQVIECGRGEKMNTLIPRLLDLSQHKVYLVAVELGVYPNTILHWLKTNNYRFDGRKKKWVKKSSRKKSSEPITYQPLEVVA